MLLRVHANTGCVRAITSRTQRSKVDFKVTVKDRCWFSSDYVHKTGTKCSFVSRSTKKQNDLFPFYSEKKKTNFVTPLLNHRRSSQAANIDYHYSKHSTYSFGPTVRANVTGPKHDTYNELGAGLSCKTCIGRIVVPCTRKPICPLIRCIGPTVHIITSLFNMQTLLPYSRHNFRARDGTCAPSPDRG